MMRISLVTSIFPPEIGGPATYASEILKRFNAKGHQIKVITPCDKAEASDSVCVAPKRRLTLRFIGFIYNHIALLASLLKTSKNCDIIYTLNPTFISLISLIAAKLLRKPMVLRFVGDKAWETAHNRGKTTKSLEDFLKSPEGGISTKKWFFLQRVIFSKVDKIIVPSCFLRDILINYYHINPAKIRVIYNSIELKAYKGESLESSRSSNKSIITVGRIIRHKRIDGIIKVINELAEELPDIGLLIVGEGPEKNNLEKLSQGIGVNSQVKFYGRASHQETMRLLKDSDIFVLNSIYEGMPHTVIEAMACRTPVIATNIKGTNEVVKNGKTGLLVAPDNDEELKEKINWLLKDGELKERLAENAYKTVEEKFTWEKNLKLLERELEEVV